MLPRLTEVFRSLLEATCPLCGSNGAYEGFNSVECPNPSCKNYRSQGKLEAPKVGTRVKSRHEIDSFYPWMIPKGTTGKVQIRNGGDISILLDKPLDPDDEDILVVPYSEAFDETEGKEKTLELFWTDWEKI